MDISTSLLALSAIAQQTRLDIFRLLVQHEPHGLPAGEVATALACPQNTVSTHLGILAQAGMVSPTRQGRSIIYRADLATFRELVIFLVRDCCAGNETVCLPLSLELNCS